MQALADFVWESNAPTARLIRGGLSPLAHTYAAFMRARASAYAHRMFPFRSLGRPTVAIGSLTVGGAGKTPIAAWVARHFLELGHRPAVLSRGYGGDEACVLAREAPGTIVVPNADRVQGARTAVARGANVIVLDDAFQRLDIDRDLDLCLVPAEQLLRANALPAGPWREGLRAVRRADLVVITVKSGGPEVVRRAHRALDAYLSRPSLTARLQLSTLRSLRGDHSMAATHLDGSRVLVSAGVARFGELVRQLTQLGMHCDGLQWADHHSYTAADVRAILLKSTRLDYVVVTEKDAGKLEPHWPAHAPPPLVAQLRVDWGEHRDVVEGALNALIARTEL